MFLVHLLQLVVGDLALPPKTRSVAPHVEPVALEELLSYECAHSVATLLNKQPGPVFAEGGLVFASTETQKGGTALIVNAGAGTYAIHLAGDGVNRIRFSIPSQTSREAKTFFVSYVHDGVLRSRYFDFGAGRPPTGRDELDYRWAPAQRAEHMLPNLEYAIYQTTKNALNALAEGAIDRLQLSKQKTAHCEHISRKAPDLARTLQHNLNVLEIMNLGVPAGSPTSVRSPASMKAH